MDKTNLKFKLNDIDDKKISIALIAPFIILTVQYFLLINLNVLGSSGAVNNQATSKILVGISFAYAFPCVIKEIY